MATTPAAVDLFDEADRAIYQRTVSDLVDELTAAGVDAGYLDGQTWETAPKASQ